jgi:hypothetical protein
LSKKHCNYCLKNQIFYLENKIIQDEEKYCSGWLSIHGLTKQK